MSKNMDFAKEIVKNFIKSIKYVFKYKPKYRLNVEKKILVAGGYGYGNTGDEAQCSKTLEILTKRYPDYSIVNLTPNLEYSKQQHPNYTHRLASRVLVFNQKRENNCFDFDGSKFKKTYFLLKSLLVYFNALLVRANLPTLFINAQTVSFLHEIKTAKLFYFCGGGYLTGSTLSRLWDGIMICRCCHLMQVPVVMSGQTIGVWGGEENENYARWGFKHVNLITVRDETNSLLDLEKIGLKGENYFATHDDALFCEKSATRQIESKEYIAMNFHYWGMSDGDKNINIDKINKIINFILDNSNYEIVFIPMHDTDRWSFEDYIKKYPNQRVKFYDYDYDFRKVRRVIADAKICITMKHHPIIFALGEDTPVISLVFSSYYLHKNLGALCQYKQEKYSCLLENEDYFTKFETLWNDIDKNYDEIIKVINEQKVILNNRKEAFLKQVDNILFS